jgi:hypothetical protein
MLKAFPERQLGKAERSPELIARIAKLADASAGA